MRQWEIENAFEPAVRIVDERLFDFGPRDLVADIDRHLVITDRQRNVASFDLGNQRADRLVDHLALKALEPEGLFRERDQLLVVGAEDLRVRGS